jgi:hypothetical protein
MTTNWSQYDHSCSSQYSNQQATNLAASIAASIVAINKAFCFSCSRASACGSASYQSTSKNCFLDLALSKLCQQHVTRCHKLLNHTNKLLNWYCMLHITLGTAMGYVFEEKRGWKRAPVILEGESLLSWTDNLGVGVGHRTSRRSNSGLWVSVVKSSNLGDSHDSPCLTATNGSRHHWQRYFYIS